VFARSPTDIGFCDLLQHDIDTADAAPIRQPPRRPPLASGTAEDDLIAEMLSAGVIEPSDSPWASPVCLAKKPDNSYWFCVDYRRVNAVSRKDAYPIPDIQDAFDGNVKIASKSRLYEYSLTCGRRLRIVSPYLCC